MSPKPNVLILRIILSVTSWTKFWRTSHKLSSWLHPVRYQPRYGWFGWGHLFILEQMEQKEPHNRTDRKFPCFLGRAVGTFTCFCHMMERWGHMGDILVNRPSSHMNEMWNELEWNCRTQSALYWQIYQTVSLICFEKAMGGFPGFETASTKTNFNLLDFSSSQN